MLKELNKVRKQHDEDMKEFSIFFETDPYEKVEGCGEESKEVTDPDIEEAPKNEKELSSVLQIMKDFNATELMEILGVSNQPVTHVETITTTTAPTTTKRGRGRKQVEQPTNDEPEEIKTSDDPKRNAVETLKREINLMEADRDRYIFHHVIFYILSLM